jgi:hypothetical protein
MKSIITIKSTYWYKGLRKATCKDTALEALKYATDPAERFEVFKSNETGEDVWAIAPVSNIGFWMDAKKTKAAAEKLCVSMGWKTL